ERLVLRGHSNEVVSVLFSPQGRTLATGSSDSSVRLWDPVTGAARSVLMAHSNGVTAVAFAPDGKHLLTAGHDKTVKVWPGVAGPLRTFHGHTGPVRVVRFSP